MTYKDQTRPSRGRVCCDYQEGCTQQSNTPIDWRSQLIGFRFYLPPSMAREVSSLLFGEAAND